MGPVRQNPIQRTVSLFICVCITLCIIVAHNIAQNRPDSFPPYPPDNHHISDDVYLREGGSERWGILFPVPTVAVTDNASIRLFYEMKTFLLESAWVATVCASQRPLHMEPHMTVTVLAQCESTHHRNDGILAL